MPGSGSEQNVHWYYKIDGKEAGPAIISRLRQMAREGTLTSEDLVRKGMAGEWVRAGTVSEIHARARTVTVDVPKELERKRVEIQRSSRLNDLQLSLRYSISGVIGSIVDRLGQIRTVAGYVILGATLMYLISTAMKWKVSDEPAFADPLTTYKSLWSELQANRKKKVNEAVWSEFSERGRKELLPIVARLEREAGATNRSSQFLLWAGRDCLPKMFNDARIEPSSSEQQLAEYLENVQLLSQGKTIYGGNQGGRRPRSSETFAITKWIAQNPVGATFNALLTATNFAIVIWFVRRKCRGTQ
jgi:hypothetical protein